MFSFQSSFSEIIVPEDEKKIRDNERFFTRFLSLVREQLRFISSKTLEGSAVLGISYKFEKFQLAPMIHPTSKKKISYFHLLIVGGIDRPAQVDETCINKG